MPLDTSQFKNEFIDPAQLKQEDWDALSADFKFRLGYHMKSTLLGKLGIDLDGPAPGRDRQGNLVLYETGENGEKLDPLATTPVDSEGFLKKLYEGKIFAIPAGQAEPVQVQLSIKTERFKYNARQGSITFSKPVTKPPRPNWWARFRHFFGGAKREFAEYDAAMEKYRNRADETVLKKRKDILAQETADRDAKKREREAAAARRKAEAKRENLARDPKEYRTALDGYMQQMLDIYGTQPKRRDEWVGDKYTIDQFNTLKPYDLKSMENEFGPVSEAEFAGVAILGALTSESAGEIRRAPGETLNRDEHVAAINTFFTSDLYCFEGGPRPGAGRYFADAQAPGRDAAAEALLAYKNGDKGPLAQLIGKGMRYFGEYMDHDRLDHASCTVCNAAIAQAVNLLERDGELMQKAMEAGMTREDLELARADKKIFEICRANEQAKARLEAAEKGEATLTEQQKRECIDARLKYETLRQAIGLEVQQKISCGEMTREDQRFAEDMMSMMIEKPMLQKKKEKKDLTDQECLEISREQEALELKEDYINNLHTFKAKRIMGVPSMFRSVGKAETAGRTAEALDKLVRENLPGREALETLPLSELNKALRPETLFAKDSLYAAPPAAEAPAEQPAAEKTAVTQQQGKERESEAPEAQIV